MKRLSTGVLALLMTAGLGLNAVAAPTSASHGNIGTNAIAQASGMAAEAPPANFGSPPSGQIPILYNDHHVYSKPDTLKQGRVLAALVKGGTVLIPLRSMFEQMGASVSYDAGSKTVTVSKPGAEVKVTVGKPEVMINGESRPLDVPPMLYKGSVLVPIRVISEGMGAYVQWVPDKQLVVVRYVPPTPPPAPATPEPTAAPTAPPTPTPAPVATPYQEKFISGDYIISPKVYNEFSAGQNNNNKDGFSYQLDGAAEFTALSLPWMLEGNYRQINYQHGQTAPTTAANAGQICDGLGGHAAGGDPGCVTAIGGQFQTFVPAFTVRNYDFDVRLGLKVLNPRVYIGVGYMFRANNAGYPRLTAFGFGAEKLPDLDQPFSIFGNLWYYPNLKGNFSNPTQNYTLSYNYMKYELGVAFSLKNSPLFFDAGFLGDSAKNKLNAPANESANGAFVGLGLKF